MYQRSIRKQAIEEVPTLKVEPCQNLQEVPPGGWWIGRTDAISGWPGEKTRLDLKKSYFVLLTVSAIGRIE